MIKKITAVCCLLAIICSAYGCRLAKADAGSAAGGDRMIGMLITTEYLDLFDFESYMNEHLGSTDMGGELILDGENNQYNGRLYATTSVPIPENGTAREGTGPSDFVFEGVDGIRYFVVSKPATETMGSYSTGISDPGIGDGHISINGTDDDESVVMEGTIYISPTALGRTYYFNPVYQDTEGNVYATSGSGCSHSGDTAEGMSFSQSYKESHTETDNGKETTSESSITITVSVKNTPEKLIILQIGADYSVITRDEFDTRVIPESITPQSGAAFIIAETQSTGADGKMQVTRDMYGRDDEYIRSYHDRGDGILLAQDTKLNWQ